MAILTFFVAHHHLDFKKNIFRLMVEYVNSDCLKHDHLVSGIEMW